MFKQLDRHPDFKEIEERISQLWKERDILNKYLHRNDVAEKRFSFLDGPITANNPMGVHHGWGRTLKDLYQRFYNMRGFKQRFQNGFDNQGLWVEVEVEKKLGFTNKKDIEEYGIGKFVEKCKKHTRHFAEVQIEQSKKLGYFMDWGNDYYTMSRQNNYAIWHFLKKVWQDGNLYQGRDSVPWCPRCGTAISQHEILTEEYKELTHDSVFFKLPLSSASAESLAEKNQALKAASEPGFKELTSFLVWTTTPWTIPGNMALAVDPDLEYLVWKTEQDEYLIFANPEGGASAAAPASAPEEENAQELNALDVVDGEKAAEVKGSDLVGLSYRAPYAGLPAAREMEGKNKYKVVAADPMILTVDPRTGTGIVHIAPGCGTEDHALGKEKDIPALPVIDGSANYLDTFGKFAGKNAKENPELIFDDLKAMGEEEGFEESPNPFFHAIVPYTHRYPTCWRCKSELVWRVVDEWYIAMDDDRCEGAADYRSALKEVIKDIDWIPEFGYDRELDWLNNMHDWLISKKRYWGLCLPIWVCTDCGNYEVIGSREELEERAVEGWEDFEGHTPHRPYVDAVKIECPECGGKASRIKDVGNPWLDAGIVAYSTLKYFEDKDYWEKWFPADLVLECFPGQFKNWFYSLLAMSTVLENTAPFQTLLGHALVKDEDGEEMHKSKGNAIWFEGAVERIGADVMRWMYARQNPTLDLRFGYGPADDIKRRFFNILWNSYKFFLMYADLDEFNPAEAMKMPDEGSFTLDTFNLSVIDRWLLSKFNLLLKEVNESLESCQNHRAVEAVEKFVVDDLSTWYIRRIRSRVGPTVQDGEDKSNSYRILYGVLMRLTKVLAIYIPYTAEELYQKLISFTDDSSVWDELTNTDVSGDAVSVHLADWPSYHDYMTDEEVLQKMKLVREICEKGHAERSKAQIKVRQPLAELTVSGSAAAPLVAGFEESSASNGYIQIIKEELNVKEVSITDNKGPLEVELDTEITEELRLEGIAREIIRNIQRARRKAGTDFDDKVTATYPDTEENRRAVEQFDSYIRAETLAQELSPGPDFTAKVV